MLRGRLNGYVVWQIDGESLIALLARAFRKWLHRHFGWKVDKRGGGIFIVRVNLAPLISLRILIIGAGGHYEVCLAREGDGWLF